MSSISDRIAIDKADRQIDAEAGAALLRTMEAGWVREGYNARMDGTARDNQAVIWSHFHRRGWDAADQAIGAQLTEIGTLDALPLQPWADVVGQAVAI